MVGPDCNRTIGDLQAMEAIGIVVKLGTTNQLNYRLAADR